MEGIPFPCISVVQLTCLPLFFFNWAVYSPKLWRLSLMPILVIVCVVCGAFRPISPSICSSAELDFSIGLLCDFKAQEVNTNERDYVCTKPMGIHKATHFRAHYMYVCNAFVNDCKMLIVSLEDTLYIHWSDQSSVMTCHNNRDAFIIWKLLFGYRHKVKSLLQCMHRRNFITVQHNRS